MDISETFSAGQCSSGSPFKNQLLNEQWVECMRMVRSIENERGFDYKYVAFSRVDIEWKAAHPSLHLIKEATGSCKRATVWAMAADDHGGLMDKYLILERSGASVIESFVDVLNSFDRLESIYRYVRNQTSTSAASPLNYERFLLHTLRHAGLCIRYMLPVAGHRLALLYANVWHQGGSWEVASGDPYVKVAWCKCLPRYCCGERSLDLGGDISCFSSLWVSGPAGCKAVTERLP